ncbi:hypothetical protein T4D_15422 [Trichinella pseudospiralis]|uniref:Uncharacterized protein n=1 Tax=Trichinella pseudospiralis TaxID=6337 RepID=A0A0V1FZF8_TRIPS|nr:hypothetical protein T4D_15422 [Trichinella pseudospiralis]
MNYNIIQNPSTIKNSCHQWPWLTLCINISFNDKRKTAKEHCSAMQNEIDSIYELCIAITPTMNQMSNEIQ